MYLPCFVLKGCINIVVLWIGAEFENDIATNGAEILPILKRVVEVKVRDSSDFFTIDHVILWWDVTSMKIYDSCYVSDVHF